ncbi:MAG: hypothetical protein ACXVPQ_02435 [Bacteroidia bacterium]
MNFLKYKTSWSNAELAIIKIALLSVGILAGLYGEGLLRPYIDCFWLLAIVTCIIGFYLWLGKLKR